MHKSSQWNYYYSLLEKYYKEHGNIDIPSSFKIDGEKVGLWLEYQKQAYRGAFGYTITQERIERLEKLGINWGKYVNSWNRNYTLLEEYYKEHGNIDVPQSYKVNGVNLGSWLNSQRQAYKVQDKNLTKDKIEKLEKLGINWGKYVNSWNRNYTLIEEYYKEHGNIDVPQSYKVNGVNLGSWLNYQRQAYKVQDKNLTKDRIEKLEKLGIKWVIYIDVWDRNYKLLEEYYKKHGNIDVPNTYKVNGINLGRWLNTQRQTYKGNGDCNLTKDRIEKLEKLGIKWEFYSKLSWEENYVLLEEYYDEHGNIDVPQSYEVNGINLGKWLNIQRQAYKGKGAYKITPYKIEKLNKLNIDWFPRETVTLNKGIKDMEIYNRVLNKKMDYILRDIKLEGMNMITSMEEQKEIEKIIVKRLFR